MPSTDYDSLTDSELRSRLAAIGYDLPISINRDFLVRKLQQAEESTSNTGNNGTTTTKKRLSLNVSASSVKVPSKRPARNSIAVNQNHQNPVPAPAVAPTPTTPTTRSQPSASLTPPRARKQTPPRQVAKPSAPPPAAQAQPNSSPKPVQAKNPPSIQRIPFTNRYVNVEESDENNQTDEETETPRPSTLFTNSRKSTSTLVPHVSTASKPASATTGSDKYMKYMKLFNNSDAGVSNRTTTTIYRRSMGSTSTSSGRFSSDDDSDGDSGLVPLRPRPKVTARPSILHKINDYVINNVPNVLLTTIITFFMLVVAIYFFNKLQNASSDPLAVVDSTGRRSQSYLPICGESGDKDCIPSDNVDDTKKLFRELRDELNERRRMIDCKSHDDDLASDNLSFAKAKSLLYRLSTLTKPAIDASFQHLLYFIIENPKLGLTLETELSNGTRTQLTNREDIRLSDTNFYITTTSTDRAWYCSALKMGLSIISYAGLIAVMAFVMFGMHHIYATVQATRKEHKQKLFSMVEDIINLLKEHHESGELTNDEPLAIQHVRDNLIQPSERTPEKMQIWNEAIEYILNNESRVREEMHHIRGEEYRVLKWLPTVSPKRSNSSAGGGWQGQAFEIVDGSPNSLPLKIPTNCLKVRHMYDSNSPLTEELKKKIEGALNCKAEIQLKHIGYDNHNDSCVYIKCYNKEDAKTAYVNLHGWWYNGNLISVKFLREQRYNTRFPESVN